MGIMKVKGLEYECDNPACGSIVFFADKQGEEPVGVSGTIREIAMSGGSKSVPWFACTPECAPLAVTDLLKSGKVWEA